MKSNRNAPSLTPETDAMVEQCQRQINVPTNPVPAEFARMLERERDEWRKKAVGLHKMEVAIHYALMHLETNYDIDGASMKDSDAARKLRSAISLENASAQPPAGNTPEISTPQ